VESVDAADNSPPVVSTLAITWGSWERIMRPSVVFDCGNSERAGTTNWCGCRRRRGLSCIALTRWGHIWCQCLRCVVLAMVIWVRLGGVLIRSHPEELDEGEREGPWVCYTGVLCSICRTAHGKEGKGTD
jgi:hypothetical protein